MEEKNGRGIFLGVVGVATLVVAIIGATFAYFSASATAGEGTINGTTFDTTGENLSLDVTKHTFTGTASVSGDKLVPTNITTTNYNTALSNNCEATPGSGTTKYTGCHVYVITATNATAGQYTLTLEMEVNSPADPQDWSYIVYTGAVGAGTGVSNDGTFGANGKATVVIDDGATTLTNGPHVFYLMVYLHDDTNVQNGSGDAASNNSTGTYSGKVTFEALGGGRVSATFASV